MSMWDKMKTATRHAKTVKSAADKTKDTVKGAYDDGLMKTTKRLMSKKARAHGRKLAMQAGKAIFRFLITPPWGWVVSGVLIAIFIALSTIPTPDLGIGSSSITPEEYTALQTNACAIDNGNRPSSSKIDLEPGKTNWSKDDVLKFATSPLTSTWKISDKDAEALFLAKNSGVATGYGLNSSNISEITTAIKNEGVSPAFFYLYGVNEGGGAGGFINHYASNTGAGAKADAIRDAQYLVQWASSVGGHPATEEWSLGSMPTETPQKYLDEMPSGSIGRVYIQATAAVTAELNDLSGITGSWSGKFGKPISDMMSMITSLGGDVSAADQISVGSNSTSLECADENSDATLKSGGLSLEDAKKFMMEKYKNVNITADDFPGALPGVPDIHDNCTVFSAFFVHKYTSLQTGAGNGMDVVRNLVRVNGGKLKETYTPSAYSVFSISPNGGPNMAGSVGHTGIVLGVDKDKGVAILGQAGYEMPFNLAYSAMEVPLSTMTKDNGWSFTDITEYMTDLK